MTIKFFFELNFDCEIWKKRKPIEKTQHSFFYFTKFNSKSFFSFHFNFHFHFHVKHLWFETTRVSSTYIRHSFIDCHRLLLLLLFMLWQYFHFFKEKKIVIAIVIEFFFYIQYILYSSQKNPWKILDFLISFFFCFFFTFPSLLLHDSIESLMERRRRQQQQHKQRSLNWINECEKKNFNKIQILILKSFSTTHSLIHFFSLFFGLAHTYTYSIERRIESNRMNQSIGCFKKKKKE